MPRELNLDLDRIGKPRSGNRRAGSAARSFLSDSDSDDEGIDKGKGKPAVQIEAGAPLLNEYKLQYFKRRWPQTFLGGIRLPPSDTPAYVYILQGIVFITPLLLAEVFTALIETDNISQLVGGIVTGVLFACYVALLKLIGHRMANLAGTNLESGFGEEDEIEFMGYKDPTTLDYILKDPSSIGTKVLSIVLSGCLGGAGVLYLLPSHIELYFSEAGAIVLHLFGWFTVLATQYGLSVASPPEPNTFRTHTYLDLRPISRVSILAIFFVIFVTTRDYLSYFDANKGLFILFAVVPLLWLFGILPPLDCLVEWLGEQCLVFGLGGSPMASTKQLFWMLLLSTISLLVTYLCVVEDSPLAAVICATVSGTVLACNIPAIIWAHAGRSNKVSPAGAEPSPSRVTTFHSIRFLQRLVYLIIGITLSVLFYEFVEQHDLWFLAPATVWLITVTIRHLRKPYIFAIIRNPFATKRIKSWLGSLHQFLTNKTPFFVLAFISPNVKNNSHQTASNILLAFGITRTYRWAWQSPSRAALDAGIVGLIAVGPGVSGSRWDKIPTVLQMTIVSFGVDRTFEFFRKLSYMARSFYTSWTLPKMRTRHHTKILLFTIFLFPVVFASLLISVALSSPLWPLFGLPVFLPGFPRPKRFWANVDGSSPSDDEIYYVQAEDAVASFLVKECANGTLDAVRPGSFYIARFQNRTVWLQVMESGYGYHNVLVKGLELQETSCHTVEATELETLMDFAFDGNNKSGHNKYFMNTALPLTRDKIETYSDTTNVLTGVIDSHTMLESVPENFRRVLVYLLLKNQDVAAGTNIAYNLSPLAKDRHHLEQRVGEFPATWLKYLKDKKLSAANEKVVDSTESAWGQLKRMSTDLTLEANIDDILSAKASPEPKQATNNHRTVGTADDPLVPFVLSCDDLTRPLANLTPKHICHVFNGKIDEPGGDWLTGDARNLLLQAYRIAVKLTIDQSLMGDEATSVDFADLVDDIQEFLDKWYVGPVGGPEWQSAASKHTPSLFGIQAHPDDPNVIQSRLLTVLGVEVSLASLLEEGVRGQWASLHVELLYFTNDDDERYSIQAHSALLRNLTVQAAAVPLGYAVYNRLMELTN